MTYQQIHEILDDFRRVHDEAAACCAAVDDASDERLRLLAELFRDGEQRLAMRLKQTQEGAPAEESTQAASLERWVQFVPTGGVDKALRNLRTATEQGSEPTFIACMVLHEQMVKALQHLAEIVPAGEAHELLQHLANMEEQAIRDLGLADTMREDG